MKKGLLILAAALLVLAPVSASAEPHRGGGDFDDHDGGHVFIGGGMGWYGPSWDSGWGWGPSYGGGWWAPTYTTRYVNTGEVKIDTRVKDAQVFINGAYLGTANDNKTIHLKPGPYKIEIREQGHAPYRANIYVTVGKTIKLHPDE
jgi:hypothetical protein